jgi:hypothetical protein
VFAEMDLEVWLLSERISRRDFVSTKTWMTELKKQVLPRF